MKAINLDEKFALIPEYFVPKIIAEHNGHHVKITKIKGEFVWHDHENEDELFIVLEGRLTIQFRDENVVLKPGELFVIPRGTEHRPVAEEETHILYIEPVGTKHSGEVDSELTKHEFEWI